MISNMFDVKVFIGGVQIGTATTTDDLTGLLTDPEVGYGRFADCKPIEITLKVDRYSAAMRLLRKAAAPDRVILPVAPTTGPRNRWGGLK